MRVLVTDGGRGSGISIIRSLGRRGIEVVAADTTRLSPAFFSRYVAARLVYPHPGAHAEEAVHVLVRAAVEHKVDLVIPVSEELVMLLSTARDRFTGIAKLALPEPDALAVARDKQQTLELAHELGVPAPRTVLVSSADDAVAHGPTLGWPIVLKPQASRTARDDGKVDVFGVTYAGDLRSLAEEMRAFEGRCSVLLQEYCEGEGHGVGLLMDRGRPLLAFQHRRLREVPFTGGPSSFRDSVALDPVLFEYCVRLLGAVGWTGPAMVEFKLTRDGPKLMEINGRIWGSLALAVKSGVDLPVRMVDLFVRGDGAVAASPLNGYAVGVRSRDLSLELKWIASVLGRHTRYPFLRAPRRRQALAAAVRLLDPRLGFDVLSRDDPRPGLVELVNIALKIPRRLARSSDGR
jgi:predicted ATP-grasp superfamily ATP-dependent carboligase